jgi:hypothetical protein
LEISGSALHQILQAQEIGAVVQNLAESSCQAFIQQAARSALAPDSPYLSHKVPSNNGKLPINPSGIVSTNDYYDGNEYEVNACVGAELAPSFFLNLGGGYAWWNETTVTEPIRYIADESSKNSATGMIGLRYAIQGFMMGLGYHTRRGVVLSLGVAFN